jgi:hypothetical protein
MAKEKRTYNHSSEVYSQPKARKAVLIVGFVVSLIALLVGVVAVLTFFIDGVGDMVSSLFSKPPLEVEKLLCWVGIGTSIVGVILSVAGANACKPIAHLSFLCVVLSFFASIAILVMSYLGMFIANVIA